MFLARGRSDAAISPSLTGPVVNRLQNPVPGGAAVTEALVTRGQLGGRSGRTGVTRRELGLRITREASAALTAA